MNLKSWLRLNFRLRRLLPLGEAARARLLGGFRLPTLLPRRPIVVPERESSQTTGEPLTDFRVTQDGRELRFLSSDPVRFEREYADWIAPLKKLPLGASADELREALNSLPGFEEQGQMFFPLEVYRQSLPGRDGTVIEWAHYCRASRQIAVDLLLAQVQPAGDASHPVDPSVLLIYGRAAALIQRAEPHA
ncbi:MAG: hypothetical protein ACJ741_04190 [Pyrinomonadaceae bacterium]